MKTESEKEVDSVFSGVWALILVSNVLWGGDTSVMCGEPDGLVSTLANWDFGEL